MKVGSCASETISYWESTKFTLRHMITGDLDIQQQGVRETLLFFTECWTKRRANLCNQTENCSELLTAAQASGVYVDMTVEEFVAIDDNYH